MHLIEEVETLEPHMGCDRHAKLVMQLEPAQYTLDAVQGVDCMQRRLGKHAALSVETGPNHRRDASGLQVEWDGLMWPVLGLDG